MTDKTRQNNLEQARLLISDGHLNEAHAMLKAIIKKNAFNEGAFNSLGALYEKSGNIEGACFMYRVALKINPDYLPAQANLNRLSQQPPVLIGLDPGN